MTALAWTANAVFALTFVVLWTLLAWDSRFVSIAIFAVIFVFGIVARRRAFFWKASLVFFGLMSAMHTFRIFGGLEPDSAGVLVDGDRTGLEILLFCLLILSTALAFAAGLQSERRRRIMS